MTNRSGEEVTRRGWPNRGCIVKNTGSQNESISSSLEHECAQKKFGVLRVTEGGDQNQYFFFLSLLGAQQMPCQPDHSFFDVEKLKLKNKDTRSP